MVGAVLVRDDRIIAEGWHRSHGGAHAEVECLAAFGNGTIPPDAVMYVTLEPCAHQGKTPPCADLLIARGVKSVVMAHADPNPQVNGHGIERLEAAGIEVVVGDGAEEARWINRRFLHYHATGRPWVVLKWAVSSDGFMDRHPRQLREVQRITAPATDVLVHRWRSEEQAIAVGGRTVINDDPQLTVRHVVGSQPLRVVIDSRGDLPAASEVFDRSSLTLLVTPLPRAIPEVDELVATDRSQALDELMTELGRRGIQSVMVEGGAATIAELLTTSLWNEARVITGKVSFVQGTKAPTFSAPVARTIEHDGDRIELFTAGKAPDPSWQW